MLILCWPKKATGERMFQREVYKIMTILIVYIYRDKLAFKSTFQIRTMSYYVQCNFCHFKTCVFWWSICYKYIPAQESRVHLCIKHSPPVNKKREKERKREWESFCLNAYFLLLAILLLTSCLDVEAQNCRPSDRIRGKKAPPEQCNQENNSDCCVEGKMYTTYKCSPPVSSQTTTYLTLNSFEDGGDGSGPSKRDNQYYSDDTPVVALSTGWFNNKGRCFNNITISANGRSVVAMVVDECDSTMGCDPNHNYQPPCANNIVDASEAVWEALGVACENWGGLDITWSNA